MKKGLALLLLTALLAGCTPQGEPPQTRWAQWENQARLDADESPQELYEAAKKEGKLVVYTCTTRMYDACDAFEAAYPGITVDAQFARTTDLNQLLAGSKDSEKPLCDVVISTDVNAMLTNSFLPEGIVYRYLPPTLDGKILPEYNGIALQFMLEAGVLFYNDNVYSQPPITNWWQLTQPEWRGKFYMVDPLRSHTTNALLSVMLEHSDEMAQAYEDLYGQPLELPPGRTAGQEFWVRMMENGIQFTSSSDEALELVGTPGLEDPPVAILVSSKSRKTGLGYNIAPIYNMQPAAGVMVPNSLTICGGAQNINAAKLFIWFILGEDDGQGAGYQPFLHEGAWSVRSDVQSPSSVQMDDFKYWTLESDYFATHQQETTEFWSNLRGLDAGATENKQTGKDTGI